MLEVVEFYTIRKTATEFTPYSVTDECYMGWCNGVVMETTVYPKNPNYTNNSKFSVSTSLNSTINVRSRRVLYSWKDRNRLHSIFSDWRMLHGPMSWRRYGNNGIPGEPVIYKYFEIQRLYITQLHYKCWKSSSCIQLESPRLSSLHIQWLSHCSLNWLIGVVSETTVYPENPLYTNVFKFSVSTSPNSTINVWSRRILCI